MQETRPADKQRSFNPPKLDFSPGAGYIAELEFGCYCIVAQLVMTTKESEIHMGRALRLARRGLGRVSPNPLVGAVVVQDGAVVGEGAHLRLGEAHAEHHALVQAGEKSRGATLFVSLEPCSHHGRTPPCTDAVIRAGIGRVVCAMEDPDPRVSGGGIRQLRDAGLEVEVGVLRQRAEQLNEAYSKHRRSGHPFVILKLAQSLDGRIATSSGQSRWITGEPSRRHVHDWRSRVDAIAVGASTVVSDNPQLDVRHLPRGARRRDPRPIVVDGQLRAPPVARVFAREGAIVAALDSASPERERMFADAGVEVWRFGERNGRIDLRDLTLKAGKGGMTSLIIEGGGRLAAAALKDGIVDRVMIYVAPRLIGEGVNAIGQLDTVELDKAIRLDQISTRRLGDDLLYTADVRYPCSRD